MRDACVTVYLVDEPFVGLAASFASKDSSARLVLLQDAVYASRNLSIPGGVYVIDDDVSRRGLKAKVPPAVHIITYEGLVELLEHEKVVNFL